MDKESFIRRVKDAEQNAGPRRAPEFTGADVVSMPRSAGTPKESFIRNFSAAGGKILQSVDELAALLKEAGCRRGYADEKLGTTFCLEDEFELEAAFERADIDRYDFAITKAAGAVGEGGMILLKDSSTSDRIATIAPWVHVAVLDASSIVATIPDAMENIADNPYSILIAAPSKTADVEGIMIEGVHGPGIQACLILD